MMQFDDLNNVHLLTPSDSQPFISPICVSSAFFTLYHTQYSYCLLVMFNEGELFVFLFVIPDYCNIRQSCFRKPTVRSQYPIAYILFQNKYLSYASSSVT